MDTKVHFKDFKVESYFEELFSHSFTVTHYISLLLTYYTATQTLHRNRPFPSSCLPHLQRESSTRFEEDDRHELGNDLLTQETRLTFFTLGKLATTFNYADAEPIDLTWFQASGIKEWCFFLHVRERKLNNFISVFAWSVNFKVTEHPTFQIN